MPDEIDPLALLRSIHIDSPAGLQPVTGGSDTTIWQLEHQAQRYALRVFRPEQYLTSQHEILAMQLAGAADIPVPQVYQSGMWGDRPFSLLSWMSGERLGDYLRGHVQQVWRIGVAFGQMQAAIHRVSPPADWDSNAWLEWGAYDDPVLCTCLQKLARPQPALLHLDYHLNNVLVNEQGVTAVLDWANTQAGDPRADFARTYTILRVEPWFKGREPLHISLFRRVLERAWRRGYQKAGGNLDHIAAFYAWAGRAMIRDLSPRIGHTWLTNQHLQRVQHWADRWRSRALNM